MRIPELNNTSDAIKFGKKATKDDIVIIEKLIEKYKKSFIKYDKNNPNLSILEYNIQIAYKLQWFRESIEVYNNTFNL
jgi:hypothetical protein